MIGEYGQSIFVVTIDQKHFASMMYDISTVTLELKPCLECQALIHADHTWMHDQWHQQNDIQVDTGPA